MKISNPKYSLKDVGLMEKPIPKPRQTEPTKKPSNYKLVCELSYGGTPTEKQIEQNGNYTRN